MSEFIPYEQALILKELGFDEKCYAYYAKHLKFELTFFENARAFWCTNSHASYFTHIFKRKEKSVNCTAPTFSQAFKWFRDKHKLNICFSYWNGYTKMLPESRWYKFECYIIPESGLSISVRMNDTTLFEKHEDAELACLLQMIKLTQKKLLND